MPEKFMGKFLNEKEFDHYCRHGSIFVASRCDFKGGVKIKNPPDNTNYLLRDVAEMIGYHAMAIHPHLNGFSGYDNITFETEE